LALLSRPDHQPASRLWTLQAIEAGIFGGAAVILLAAAIWRVSRRDADGFRSWRRSRRCGRPLPREPVP